MITAIDSNILFDFLESDSEFGTSSRDALRSCATEGRLLMCEVVCAEVAGYYSSSALLQDALQALDITFSPLTLEAALEAGNAWKAHRARGGTRTRVAADFLIGAHALTQADRLLTRDQGFYRTYFKHLRVLDPSRH